MQWCSPAAYFSGLGLCMTAHPLRLLLANSPETSAARVTGIGRKAFKCDIPKWRMEFVAVNGPSVVGCDTFLVEPASHQNPTKNWPHQILWTKLSGLDRNPVLTVELDIRDTLSCKSNPFLSNRVAADTSYAIATRPSSRSSGALARLRQQQSPNYTIQGGI